MSSDTNVELWLVRLHTYFMAKDNKKTGLGGRIAAARKNANLSQTELGKAFGLTRSAVSQWESEGTEPTPSNLRAIATRCGVDYSWLATNQGTMIHTEQDPDLLELTQLLREASPEVVSAVRILLKQRKPSVTPELAPGSLDRRTSSQK